MIESLTENNPDMAWLKTMSDRGDVDYTTIAEVFKQTHDQSRNLGVVSQIIIAIAVTVATGGSGTGAVLAMQTAATVSASTMLATAAINSGLNGEGLDGVYDRVNQDSTWKGMASAAFTAGVTAGFGDTYNLGRFAAETATGCVAGEITGAGCSSGAQFAAAFSAASWLSHEMRVDQIKSSEQFTGVCEGDKCYSNMSGADSYGIDGDNTQLQGTRISKAELEKLGTVTTNPDGTWSFTGNVIKEGKDKGGIATLDYALNKQLGPTGGSQALPATFFGNPVPEGTFMNILQESVAGSHDWLADHLTQAYSTAGNAVETASKIRLQFNEMMSIVTIPMALPFGLATLNTQIPGLAINIQNALRDQKNESQNKLLQEMKNEKK